MTLYANIDTQAGPELSVPGGIYDSVSFPGGPPWSFALKAGWRKLSSEIPPVPTGKKRSTLKFVQDPDNAESCTFTATYTDLVYSISKMKLCDAMEARELT